jgi:hypothetical protein
LIERYMRKYKHAITSLRVPRTVRKTWRPEESTEKVQPRAMASILIGTPCYGGMVNTDFMLSMLGLQSELTRQGIDFGVQVTTTVSLIPVARNFIVSKLLEWPPYTHLLFIDADLAFDPKVVPRYLAADKDIVAGIYPIKHLDMAAVRNLPPGAPIQGVLNYAVKVCDGEQPTPDGFIRAEYAATGFMLIKRQVLERMVAHYPELKYRDMFARVASSEPARDDNLYALFDTSLDRERGQYLPEDYTFCNRWRAMGGEIWVDVLSKFTHIGQFAYEGDFSVFVKRT